MMAMEADDAQLAKREKELDLHLKEMAIEEKEYQKNHRPSGVRSLIANPATMGALIAAWASLTATGITWIAGNISANAQRESAAAQAEADARKFQTQILVAALSKDKCSNAGTLATLLKSKLITGDLIAPVTQYIGQTVIDCKVDPLK